MLIEHPHKKKVSEDELIPPAPEIVWSCTISLRKNYSEKTKLLYFSPSPLFERQLLKLWLVIDLSNRISFRLPAHFISLKLLEIRRLDGRLILKPLIVLNVACGFGYTICLFKDLFCEPWCLWFKGFATFRIFWSLTSEPGGSGVLLIKPVSQERRSFLCKHVRRGGCGNYRDFYLELPMSVKVSSRLAELQALMQLGLWLLQKLLAEKLFNWFLLFSNNCKRFYWFRRDPRIVSFIVNKSGDLDSAPIFTAIEAGYDSLYDAASAVYL